MDCQFQWEISFQLITWQWLDLSFFLQTPQKIESDILLKKFSPFFSIFSIARIEDFGQCRPFFA